MSSVCPVHAHDLAGVVDSGCGRVRSARHIELRVIAGAVDVAVLIDQEAAGAKSPDDVSGRVDLVRAVLHGPGRVNCRVGGAIEQVTVAPEAVDAVAAGDLARIVDSKGARTSGVPR